MCGGLNAILVISSFLWSFVVFHPINFTEEFHHELPLMNSIINSEITVSDNKLQLSRKWITKKVKE